MGFIRKLQGSRRAEAVVKLGQSKSCRRQQLGHSRSCRYQLGPSGSCRQQVEESKLPWWTLLKRKMTLVMGRRERRVFANYEPEDYWLNFDQGVGSQEPDNLPRSFSARYADPSRLMRRISLLS